LLKLKNLHTVGEIKYFNKGKSQITIMCYVTESTAQNIAICLTLVTRY